MINAKKLLIAVAVIMVLLGVISLVQGKGGSGVLYLLLGAACVGTIPLMGRAVNARVARGVAQLEEGEEIRYKYQAPWMIMGTPFVIITTERLILPPNFPRRHRSILFSQIYLANTNARSATVGAYSHGLLIGTNITSKYLELDLINDDVVRINVARPHVLQQRLIDAYEEWSERP